MGQRRERHIRVRGKRLDQVNETKLALAVWMLARKIVTDGTEEPSTIRADGASAEPRKKDAQPRAALKETT